MRKRSKNKMAGVNSRFASVSESIFNGFLLKMLLRSPSVYMLWFEFIFGLIFVKVHLTPKNFFR